MNSPVKIDVFGEPPSIATIEAWRQKLSAELSLAEKVTIFTPIPVIDFIAGMTTAIIEGDKYDPIRYSEKAEQRDWSSNSTVLNYVQKVKAMNRPLIQAEVEALQRHLNLVNTLNYATKTAGTVLQESVTGIIKDMFKSSK